MLFPYEPRSTDCWDDDDGPPAEPMGLLEFLAALILFLPLTAICMVVFLVCVTAQSLWEIVKPASADWRNGDRRSGLTLIVICLAVLLFAGWRIIARPEVEAPPARALITPPTLSPTATPTRTAARTPEPVRAAVSGSAMRTVAVACGQPAPFRGPAWRSAPCARPAAQPALEVPHMAPAPTPSPTQPSRLLRVLVDDFEPEPVAGQPVYYYNRLEGDRGAINNAALTFGAGQVTTTVSAGNAWAGAWLSLNHPIREQASISLDAVLPPQIRPEYQSAVVGIEAQVAAGSPGRSFRLELKDHGEFRWTGETVLTGGPQPVAFDLPQARPANELVWVLDHAGHRSARRRRPPCGTG